MKLSGKESKLQGEIVSFIMYSENDTNRKALMETSTQKQSIQGERTVTGSSLMDKPAEFTPELFPEQEVGDTGQLPLMMMK